MKLVVDTNVLIAAVLIEDDEIKQILTDSIIVAPTLIGAELGNVFLKYVRHRGYSIDDANKKMHVALSIIDEYIDWMDDKAEVMRVAIAYKLSFYDAIYLQICRENGFPLYTLDKKLKKAAESMKLSF